MAKPDDLPDWASDATYSGGPDEGLDTKLEPTSGEKASGFIRTLKPPARKMNWILNNLGAWARYLTKNTTIDTQVFTSSGSAEWTKPAWATDSDLNVWTDVIVVPGGQGGNYNGGGFGGGAGGGSIPIFASFPTSMLDATEDVIVGAGGIAGVLGDALGKAGGNSVFADGKAYAVVNVGSAPSSTEVHHGGSGGTGGGAGSVGATGEDRAGDGGILGGPGGNYTRSDPGQQGGFGAFRAFGNVPHNSIAGAGQQTGGGGGGTGWGAGGGGAGYGEAGSPVVNSGGGGGGAGWTGWPGYPSPNNAGSFGVAAAGIGGIVVAITYVRGAVA